MKKQIENLVNTQLSFDFPESKELHINVKKSTSYIMSRDRSLTKNSYISNSVGVSRVVNLHNQGMLPQKRKEFIDKVLKETKSF